MTDFHIRPPKYCSNFALEPADPLLSYVKSPKSCALPRCCIVTYLNLLHLLCPPTKRPLVGEDAPFTYCSDAMINHQNLVYYLLMQLSTYSIILESPTAGPV